MDATDIGANNVALYGCDTPASGSPLVVSPQDSTDKALALEPYRTGTPLWIFITPSGSNQNGSNTNVSWYQDFIKNENNFTLKRSTNGLGGSYSNVTTSIAKNATSETISGMIARGTGAYYKMQATNAPNLDGALSNGSGFARMSTSGPDSTITVNHDPFNTVFLKFRNKSGSTISKVELYDGWPFTSMTKKMTCTNVSSTNGTLCETSWAKTGGGFVTARVFVGPSTTYDIYLEYP